MTIPRLLCGAYLFAYLLHHVCQCLKFRYSMFMHGQIALLCSTGWMEALDICRQPSVYYHQTNPPEKWNHISGLDNSADCASRGLLPSELLQHQLWWDGPLRLKQSPANWHQQIPLQPNYLKSLSQKGELSSSSPRGLIRPTSCWW